jgi:hypothetical protein
MSELNSKDLSALRREVKRAEALVAETESDIQWEIDYGQYPEERGEVVEDE